MNVRVLLGAVGALISIGLAAPASADPVTTAGAVGAPQPDAVPNFPPKNAVRLGRHGVSLA